MLRKNVKNLILREKTLRDKQDFYVRKKPRTAKERARDARIKKTALKAIEDLKFLMENLPEKQLEQIFNYDTMKPFFNALLSLESDHSDSRHVDRIRFLWKSILVERINDHDYMRRLVGMDVYTILVTSDIMTPSKVLSYLSMFEHREDFPRWEKYSLNRLRSKQKKQGKSEQ